MELINGRKQYSWKFQAKFCLDTKNGDVNNIIKQFLKQLENAP